jgi:hypothetical protein
MTWFRTILKNLLGDTGPETPEKDYSFTPPQEGLLSKQSASVDVKFNEKTGLVTESEAAARYFKEKHRGIGLYLCVDIGGGTSDISVWSQESGKVDYLFQSSVRFASVEMFVDPLHKLLNSGPAVLDAVFKKYADDPIRRLNYFWGARQDSSDNPPKMNTEQLSAVLSEYADEVRKRLGQKNLTTPAFVTYVTIAYSGLCFYLAHIIAALVKENKIPLPDVMVFGLSGRGAKLTEWIDADAVYKEMEKLISKLVHGEKSGASFKIKSEFSKGFVKTETAKGLLCDSIGSAKPSATIYMGAGMSFTKDGQEPEKRKADDFVSLEDDFAENPAEWTASFDSGLDSLEEFVEFFDKVAITSKMNGYDDVKQLGRGWFKKIKANLKTVIDNEFGTTIHSKKGSGPRFESPFIAALKVFLSEAELHFQEDPYA